jgi:hypothetical protein
LARALLQLTPERRMTRRLFDLFLYRRPLMKRIIAVIALATSLTAFAAQDTGAGAGTADQTTAPKTTKKSKKSSAKKSTKSKKSSKKAEKPAEGAETAPTNP